MTGSMAQSVFLIVVFIGVLALFPLAIRWLQKRNAAVTGAVPASARLVSAIAVGPQQRVVTVEVGPDGARSWLVLGVTGQSITCLHTVASPQPVPAPTFAEVAGGLPRA